MTLALDIVVEDLQGSLWVAAAIGLRVREARGDRRRIKRGTRAGIDQEKAAPVGT